jgi:hypothetical protein
VLTYRPAIREILGFLTADELPAEHGRPTHPQT